MFSDKDFNAACGEVILVTFGACFDIIAMQTK